MINLEKIDEEVNILYNLLNGHFTVFPSIWKTLFKKLRNNSGLFNVDYAIKRK